MGKAQSIISVHSHQDPFGVPRATSISLTVQLWSGPSHREICHIAICGLHLLLTDRAALLAFCASQGSKRLCPHTTLLCIAVVRPDKFILWTEVVTLRKHTGISACSFQSHCKPGWGFSNGLHPTLMAPSNFHSDFHRLYPIWTPL